MQFDGVDAAGVSERELRRPHLLEDSVDYAVIVCRLLRPALCSPTSLTGYG